MYRKVLIAISLYSLVACSNSGAPTDMIDIPDESDSSGEIIENLQGPVDVVEMEPSPNGSAVTMETPLNDQLAIQPLIMTGTSGSPEETQLPVGTNNDTQAIAGSWDFTRVTVEGMDIVFATIESNGSIVEYDYQQDSVGNQQDCFIVRNTTIAARGANQYDIQDTSSLPGSQGSEDILITMDDGELLFRFFLLESSLEEGDVLSPRSERFPQSEQDLSDAIVCSA